MNYPKICLLLTATIDPKNCFALKRKDPRVRERDYVSSLKKWINETTCPIVFCENSAYGLCKIKKITEEAVKKGRAIEILQFDGNNYPRELGKGYGELLIIRHALENSNLLKHADYIIKVTGRYFITNIKKIINSLQENNNFYVMAGIKEFQANSVIFIAKPDFICNYLSKYQDSLDDSKSFYFEHALHRAIEDSIKGGHKFSHFKYLPFICGYSGGHNYFVYGTDPFIPLLRFPYIIRISFFYLKHPSEIPQMLKRKWAKLIH